MRHETAAERVRTRVSAWLASQGHGSKTRLSNAIPADFGDTKSNSWVTDVATGKTEIALRYLDAIADHMGVPPGELVRRDDHLCVEVTMTELRLLRYFRSLPEIARRHWMGFIDFLAQERDDQLTHQAAERRERTALAARYRRRSHPKAG